MATLKLRRGKWFSRIQWRDKNARMREKQIPLRTSDKVAAHKRNAEVEKYEKDIKDGLSFDFSWLKDGGNTIIRERSISDTVDEYIIARRIEGIRESTIERIEVAVKSLYTLVKKSSRLENINDKLIERYKRHCVEVLGLKPNTVNINLSKIRALLNWSLRKRYIKDLPHIEMLQVDQSEVDYLSDQMLKEIMSLGEIDNHYKRAFVFYFETGCRLFEPFNGFIKGNTLVIPPIKSKTHRKRTIVLNDLIKAILVEIRSRVSKCSGNRKYAVKNYSRVFKKACRLAGLPERYHFHNLRDTYAVRRWAVSGDIHLISKEIGHRSVTTTEKYADFELNTLLVDFPSLKKWIAPRLEKPSLDESFLKAINPQLIPLKDTKLKDTKVFIMS